MIYLPPWAPGGACIVESKFEIKFGNLKIIGLKTPTVSQIPNYFQVLSVRLCFCHSVLNSVHDFVHTFSRLSTEKAAAEELLDEVKHEQSLLKKDLGKAQKVLEGTMAAQGGNFQENWQMRPRQSSPETSASSFDFFPTASSSSIRLVDIIRFTLKRRVIV